MKSLLSYLLPISFLLSFIGTPVSAQVTTDGTTDTTVSADGNDFTIQDGDTAGSNLFHSFQDFSVPNGGSAFFDNAETIENIFSRVTGGNISNIDGLLRTNDASLFLINPAGIIFGAGASLNLGGGSFYGSSADSILFEDGEFSATDLENPPLLTVNAPIGLSFRDNPGSITNNSLADDVGLQVASGATLALIGGNISFTGGIINSAGVNVFLGGLSEAETISLDENLNPSFPADAVRADVSFSETARVIVTGDNGGSITVTGNDLEFTGASELLGGIAENGGGNNSQAGDISLDATGAVSFSGESNIENRVNAGATGNSGNINVNAQTLSLTDGGYFSASTFGMGNAGDINVNVLDAVELSGESENELSRFSSVIAEGSEGSGGNITINASSVSIDAGALLNISVFGAFGTIPAGIGNAGNINISADSFSLSNAAELRSDTGGIGNAGNIIINANNNLEVASSRINSSVQEMAVGRGGTITLIGSSISISDGSAIGASTFPNGENINGEQVRGGDIELNVSESLNITGNSGLFSGTSGKGNAGNLTINGQNANISVTKNTSEGEQDLDSSSSGIIFSSSSNDFGNTSGDAGDIVITAKSLTLDGGGFIDSSVFGGTGNAGNIRIDVTENLDLIDFSIGSDAGFSEEVIPTGNAGNLTINADSFSAGGNTDISSVTFGSGDAGTISINANSLSLNGDTVLSTNTSGSSDAGTISINANSFSANENSFIVSGTNNTGNAGNITINADSVSFTSSRGIDNSTLSSGNAGNINISAENNLEIVGSNINSSVGESATGQGGRIILTAPSISLSQAFIGAATISNDRTVNAEQVRGGDIEINVTESLSLAENSTLFSSTTGTGDAGNITINAEGANIIFGNNVSQAEENGENSGSVFSSTIGNGEGNGDAGNINIIAQSLTLGNEATIDSGAFGGTSDGGNISIDVAENINLNNSTISSSASLNGEIVPTGNAGTIDINTGSLSATDSSILTGTFGSGDAGDITINADNNIELSGSQINNSSVAESATGKGGEIFVSADSLSLQDGSVILAVTNAPQPAGASPSEINLSIEDTLTLRDNSVISAQATNNASGGNINIDAGFVVAFPSTSGDGNDILATASGEGTGGDINIETRQIFGLEERQARLNNASNDIDASSEFGLDGNVTITIFDPTALERTTELPSNTVEAEAIAANVCSADNTVAEGSSLTIRGKGGVPPEPTEPLSSDVINIAESAANDNSETDDAESVSIDDIVPARGVKVTESGEVILTAYPVDSNGDRLPRTPSNCS